MAAATTEMLLHDAGRGGWWREVVVMLVLVLFLRALVLLVCTQHLTAHAQWVPLGRLNMMGAIGTRSMLLHALIRISSYAVQEILAMACSRLCEHRVLPELVEVLLRIGSGQSQLLASHPCGGAQDLSLVSRAPVNCRSIRL